MTRGPGQRIRRHAAYGLGSASGNPDALEAAIRNQETAFAMQASVPELADFSGEPKATLDLYGFEALYPPTRTFARQKCTTSKQPSCTSRAWTTNA